jgi:hypothetical protein
MTIPGGGDIGDAVYTVDQTLTPASGIGSATINGKDQGRGIPSILVLNVYVLICGGGTFVKQKGCVCSHHTRTDNVL